MVLMPYDGNCFGFQRVKNKAKDVLVLGVKLRTSRLVIGLCFYL